jgi:hypothetical protein
MCYAFGRVKIDKPDIIHKYYLIVFMPYPLQIFNLLKGRGLKFERCNSLNSLI